MPNIILFDDPLFRRQLLPFTYTRPVSGIRCGIHTLSEKWANRLGTRPSYLTESYLQPRFPLHTTENNLYINGALCPDQNIIEALSQLSEESVLCSEQDVILGVKTKNPNWKPALTSALSKATYKGTAVLIRNVWDIFTNNGSQITQDFEYLISNRKSEPITDPFTRCYRPDRIFVEPGANIKAAVLNAENGPIYIGKNAAVQEGASIQGPFAMGEGSVVAQNAKIRINTSIGPFCKIGGEVSGSVLFGYSNKGHEGYLGNSVLGEWCNLGANTNNSNLKNDHTNVKLHSYVTDNLKDTGLINCGLFMGDYSKAGISTMFNTGTVVGVNVNVFGGGFQPKHVPSFSWGGNAEGFTEYRFDKAMAVATDTLRRRDVIFDDNHRKMLLEVFQQTQYQRSGI